MEIKLFGKSLFSAKKSQAAIMMNEAVKTSGESKYLPDFHGRIGNSDLLSSYVEIPWNNAVVAVPSDNEKVEKKEVKKESKTITPKDVYDLKMLNETAFELNTNHEYVDKQLEDFKDKLGMLNAQEFDMRNGVNEISSIIVRLENRKKYKEVKDVFEEYPYTTSSKIAEVVKSHDNLQIGSIAQFMADLPKEAIETMKKYDAGCKKLCGKQAVYYIIADKKDFKKSDQRRDPILLAQSPFGHVWQILGAWDKEMMFLQEL